MVFNCRAHDEQAYTVREGEGAAAKSLQHANPLAVMPKGPMPEVSRRGLAAVEPLVQPEVTDSSANGTSTTITELMSGS